jgi:hypothetical protein
MPHSGGGDSNGGIQSPSGEHHSNSTDTGDLPTFELVKDSGTTVVYWLPSGHDGDQIELEAGWGSGANCAFCGAPSCTWKRVNLPNCPDLQNCGPPTEATHAQTNGADVVIVPVQVALAYAENAYPNNITMNFASDGSNPTAERHMDELRGYRLKEEYLPTRPAVRILYWRESYDYVLPIKMQEQFDMLMGHQYFAHIIQPSFLKSARDIFFEVPPSANKEEEKAVWREAIRRREKPIHERPGMAVSIISHCDSTSLRSQYIDELAKYVKIDRFGSCNPAKVNERVDGSFPTGIAKASEYPEVISFTAQYKFYLGFENELAHGYVTEKLLENPLLSGNIPVHLGLDGPHEIPSIDGTGNPWFISALDFESPAKLGHFMNQLAEKPEELEKYVAWRKTMNKHSTLFPHHRSIQKAERVADKESVWSNHLTLLPEEIKTALKVHKSKLDRTASSCYVCDKEYMSELRKKPMQTVAASKTRAESAAKEGLPASAAGKEAGSKTVHPDNSATHGKTHGPGNGN